MEVKKSWVEDTKLGSDAYKQLKLDISQLDKIPLSIYNV
jgi:hypothetical protein